MTEGYLIHDAENGRYKIVGRQGLHDYNLHFGDQLELWIDGQWIRVRIEEWPNEQKVIRWRFFDEHNKEIYPQEQGQRARLAIDPR